MWLVVTSWTYIIMAQPLQRLGLGTILHPEVPIQLQTNVWRHVIMLPLPQKMPTAPDLDPCRTHAAETGKITRPAYDPEPQPQQEEAEALIKQLCEGYEGVRDLATSMNTSMNEDIDRGLETISAILADAAHAYSMTQISAGNREKRALRSPPQPYSYHYAEITSRPLVRVIRALNRRQKPKRRVKRLIGTIIAVWSHTTLKTRLEALEETVIKLAEADETMIVHLSQEVASVLNLLQKESSATRAKFAQVRAAMKTLSHLAQNLSDKVSRHNWMMGRWRAYTEYALISHVQTYQIMQQYLNYIDRLALGVHALTRGELSPQLISVRDLNRTFALIQIGLMRNLPDYHIGLPRLEDLYHLPLEAVSVHENILYVTLAVPIARTEDLFSVYRIQTFPMAAGDNNTNRFTQLVGTPDYLAVYGDYFVEMTHTEYMQCVGDLAIRTCFTRFIEHDVSQQTCALALYQNDVEAALRKCDVHYQIQNPPLDLIVPLGDDTLYVVTLAEPGTWTLSCAGQRPSTEPSCTACEVRLPCQCGLHTTHTYVPAPLSGCETYSSRQHLQPPVYLKNIAYLYKMGGHKVKQLMEEIRTPNRMAALGPGLLLDDALRSEEEEAAATEQQLDIDMKQLDVDIRANLMKWKNTKATEQKRWRHLAKTAHHTSRHIGLVVIITIILLGGVIVLGCVLTGKYRTLATSYGLLTSIPTVRTQESPCPDGCMLTEGCQIATDIQAKIMALRQGLPDPTCAPVCEHITDHIPPVIEFTFMAAAAIALMIMIGKQIVKLYVYRHSVYRPSMWFPWAQKGGSQTRVLLEVGNAKEFVILDLQKMVGSPLRYRLGPMPVSTHGMPKLSYKLNRWSHHLQIDWKAIQLIDDTEQSPVWMERVVTVPYMLRNATKRILAQPLSLRMLIGSLGVYDGYPIATRSDRTGSLHNPFFDTVTFEASEA